MDGCTLWRWTHADVERGQKAQGEALPQAQGTKAEAQVVEDRRPWSKRGSKDASLPVVCQERIWKCLKKFLALCRLKTQNKNFPKEIQAT